MRSGGCAGLFELPKESRWSIFDHAERSCRSHAGSSLGTDPRAVPSSRRRRALFRPRGFRSIRLPVRLAAAVSVAAVVAGVAGSCEADEVLPAPRVHFVLPDPSPQREFRFVPGYGSGKRAETIGTRGGALHAPVVAQALAPPSPGVPPADFHVPQGPGRLGVLEPPRQFLHWTDHLEIVLPPGDVARRCETAGVNAAPGERIHGCSYTVAGRCVIVRVDDPGVARHELAHCNGWKHPARVGNPRP